MEEDIKDESNIGHIFDKIKGMMIDYDGVLDMTVSFKVDLAETRISLDEFLSLKKGSVINLQKAAGESAEIFVNNKVGSKCFHLIFDTCMQCSIIDVVKNIRDLV